MGLYGISSVNSNMTSYVSSFHFCENRLSEELIRKLIQLGIDPSKVQNNAEAQKLIAQAEKEQKVEKTQDIQETQPAQNKESKSNQFQQLNIANPNVDMKQLNDDIKTLGEKLGIDVKTIGTLKDIVNKFDVTIKEFTTAAAAQSNKNATAQFDNIQRGVKISTGAEIKDKPETIQTEFKDIKDRVDKLEQATTAMFAGQEMIAMLNRMALGI